MDELNELLDILDDIHLTVANTAKQQTELIPQYKTVIKTCTGCGTQFTGQQKYYQGYEGDFLKEVLYWCPFCYKDKMSEYWRKVHNFALESVIRNNGTVVLCSSTNNKNNNPK